MSSQDWRLKVLKKVRVFYEAIKKTIQYKEDISSVSLYLFSGLYYSFTVRKRRASLFMALSPEADED